MSNITTQTIRVDLSTDKVIPSAFTHQNDTARTLEFSMYNKGVPYTMTGNTVIHNRPTPPTGFDYKLKADTLTWELVELPEPSDTDDDATESDYITALQDLGVEVGG